MDKFATKIGLYCIIIAVMDIQQIIGLIGFAFATSITPGPNNLMLMASGVNFGIRRTVPHILGVSIGFTLMIIVVGIGLVGLFEAWPFASLILKVVSAGYLLWLAWKIASAPLPKAGEQLSTGNPMTFIQAALFQWINPKAWTMALTALTVYVGTRDFITVLGVAVIFGVINLPSVGIWTAMGQYIRRRLAGDLSRRLFNWGMAALLVASLTVAL